MDGALARGFVDTDRRRAPFDETIAPVVEPAIQPRTGQSAWLLATVAAIPALLYLAYVYHYSLDVPLSDDWSLIGLASFAVHHHVPMIELWGQYADTRLFVGRVIFAASGRFDHLNLKHIILLSAAIYVASYAMLLSLLRSYLRRPLTILPVLSIAVVWFSVADFQNSLWSFQLAWYLVVFFFVAMAYCLGISHHHRNLFFALGALAAVLASLSEVQGFGVWAVGLICLVWTHPRARRTYYECAVWMSAALLVTAIYLHNFDFHHASNICQSEGGSKGSCALAYGVLHPVLLARFMSILAGNVVPTLPGRSVGVHELLGSAIWIAAGFVVVLSVRKRRLTTGPLPVLLIVFAFQFDLMLALSRLGQGATGAGKAWYTMPNIILLAGIVAFAARYFPGLPRTQPRIGGRLRVVGLAALAGFLVFQLVVATQFGVANGREFRTRTLALGRLLANFTEIPDATRECYVETATDRPTSADIYANIDTAMADHLTLFASDEWSRYHADGPPRNTFCDIIAEVVDG